MIQCQNLSKADLKRIGAWLAEAFQAEPGYSSGLPQKDAETLFTLLAETFYRKGHLYTTGEEQEGFCAYWTKSDRLSKWDWIRLGMKMAVYLSPKAGKIMQDSQSDWMLTEKRYADQDYVEVFLVAIRREYQGQGLFRQIMAEPFTVAKKRGCCCVLDSDSEAKVAKYNHVGMRTVASQIQRSGITMYALEI